MPQPVQPAGMKPGEAQRQRPPQQERELNERTLFGLVRRKWGWDPRYTEHALIQIMHEKGCTRSAAIKILYDYWRSGKQEPKFGSESEPAEKDEAPRGRGVSYDFQVIPEDVIEKHLASAPKEAIPLAGGGEQEAIFERLGALRERMKSAPPDEARRMQAEYNALLAKLQKK